MKPSVILYKPLPDDLFSRLKQHCHVTSVNDLSQQTLTQYAEHFAHAKGLLGAGEKIDGTFLSHMPALRAVSTISVGYDNFDLDALNTRGILLMNTPDVLTETVADTLMLLMLTTARRALEVAERVKNGEWKTSIDADWFGVDVHHKTLGIIGMGRIGNALATRAHFGFGMPVLYYSRQPHREAEARFNARFCEPDTLFAQADFVCSILPLTEATYHLIGSRQFAMMKPSAIFINAGRGPVVDENALIKALEDGSLRAAGLDVFEHEPLKADSPLLRMPNVVAFPHIGSATHETRYNMAACAVDNLLAALSGKVKENCVNLQVLRQ